MIRPGDLKSIQSEGMPIRGNPFNKGKLFVKFTITFPKNGEMSGDQIQALENILPKRPTVELDLENGEESELHDVDPQVEARRRKRRRERLETRTTRTTTTIWEAAARECSAPNNKLVNK